MTTYSQGPWEVFQSGRDEALYVASHKGNVVAFLGPEDEDENADLIAAAPELLEALIQIVCADSPYSSGGLCSDQLEQAKRAINKATGEDRE